MADRADQGTVRVGAVVDEVGNKVLEVAPGTVVVVVVVDVVDVVAGFVVVDVVEVVVGVVVVEDGDTPLITPPTVVPDFGPPKIDDRERPALTSTKVTTPSPSTNAAKAEATAAMERRQRLSTAVRAARRRDPLASASEGVWLFMTERLNALWACAADCETRDATVVATAAPGGANQSSLDSEHRCCHGRRQSG